MTKGLSMRIDDSNHLIVDDGCNLDAVRPNPFSGTGVDSTIKDKIGKRGHLCYINLNIISPIIENQRSIKISCPVCGVDYTITDEQVLSLR